MLQGMSDDQGFSALVMVMVVASVVIFMSTNRMYGQPTFFSPSPDRSARDHVTKAPCRLSTRITTSRHGRFHRLPEVGVLDMIWSFFLPADLVGIAAVSTTFLRRSTSEHLWRNICTRTLSHGARPLHLLGEAWRLEQQKRHQHYHQQRRDVEDEKQPTCCSCGGGHHRRWPRATKSSGSGGSGSSRGDSEPSPSSLSCSRCDQSCYSYFSWREAFFRAHRTKPQDLLHELSSSSSSSSDREPPSPPQQQCMVVLYDKIYDLTSFLPSHPGGALILQEHASTDATQAFDMFFHSREARRMARQFVVWDGEAVMGRRGTLWRVAHHRFSSSS